MKSRSKFLINLFTIFAVLPSLFGSAVFVTPAYAAGIIVNTATDEDVANAACSLREAIIAANTDTAYNGCSAGAGTDTITFAANYTITLASQLPVVTTQITISGNGQTNTIIQASSCNPVTAACAHTYRVISVPGGNLTLSNLTARNGQVIGDLGGNILVGSGGTLSLNATTISGGHARWGGGIGAAESSTVNITDSTISGNLADDGITGSFDSGGGLRAYDAFVVITSSTISDNTVSTSSGAGSGVYIEAKTVSSSLQVTNSTISANSGGDGIYFLDSRDLIIVPLTGTITNSTISGNAGGVSINWSSVTFKNTIIANNGTDCNKNIDGTVTDGGGNLVEDNTCGFSGGSDPQLGGASR